VTGWMQLFVNNWISANKQFPPSSYNGQPVYAKYKYISVQTWE
jgi:endo-1,3-1,4-beta-glycanase ExoK